MKNKEKKLEKKIDAQNKIIKILKKEILRLKWHLACLGVGKKPFWKIKKD